MGAVRRWWCKVASWTLWPMLKGLGLGFMMFVVICMAALIAWAGRWLWHAIR